LPGRLRCRCGDLGGRRRCRGGGDRCHSHWYCGW
jgi:hypothetical protein